MHLNEDELFHTEDLRFDSSPNQTEVGPRRISQAQQHMHFS